MNGTMQERTLGEIAEFVGGRVRGDPNLRIRTAATLNRAGPGDISFLVNPKYEKQLEGTQASAVIGQGSKLGDLVTIGHGARIGSHRLLVAQVGIADSTTLGHHCTIGGQVGVVGHVTIGNNVTIGAQAGVVNNIPDGETVLGAPAIDAGQARRAYTMLPYLPQMRQDLRALQSQVEKLAAESRSGEKNGIVE